MDKAGEKKRKNKDYAKRYRRLDEILAAGGGTILEIRDKLNHTLDEDERVNSPRILRQNIESLGQHPGVTLVIERDPGDRRSIRYYYEHRGMSVYKLPISSEDTAQLIQCLGILSRFEGLPNMEWLDEFTDRFKKGLRLNLQTENAVGFDANPYLMGLEHFTPLLTAIGNHRTLRIRYQGFRHSEPREMVIYPYYLKEYNRRWFLLGGTQGYEGISNWALDRIVSIEEEPEIYYRPHPGIDFANDYFADIVGVSRYRRPLEKVRIWASPQTAPYIQTKPLHESQKPPQPAEDGTIFEIEVIPNYELEQLLLSFGEGIRVLEPADLVARLASHARRLAALYPDDIDSEPV